MNNRRLNTILVVILILNILLAITAIFLLIQDQRTIPANPQPATEIPVANTVVPHQLPTLLPTLPAATIPPATPAIPQPTVTPGATSSAPVKVLAAGDVAVCNAPGTEITAGMLDLIPDIPVLLLGDTVNEEGSVENYSACFDPTWGRHIDRLHPVPGNHDYDVTDAVPYYDYFGAAAGIPQQGYYSFNLGSWHVVALNSNCAEVGGCGPESQQYAWLLADLAANPATCTLAYWHHPLFSSNRDNGLEEMSPVWDLLYMANADVVLNGHDHIYERYAPQTPDGVLDIEHGIRQFVIGTGGAELRGSLRKQSATGELQIMQTFGIFELTLHADRYDWQFIPQPGKTTGDSGSGVCH